MENTHIKDQSRSQNVKCRTHLQAWQVESISALWVISRELPLRHQFLWVSRHHRLPLRQSRFLEDAQTRIHRCDLKPIFIAVFEKLVTSQDVALPDEHADENGCEDADKRLSAEQPVMASLIIGVIGERFWNSPAWTHCSLPRDFIECQAKSEGVTIGIHAHGDFERIIRKAFGDVIDSDRNAVDGGEDGEECTECEDHVVEVVSICHYQPWTSADVHIWAYCRPAPKRPKPTGAAKITRKMVHSRFSLCQMPFDRLDIQRGTRSFKKKPQSWQAITAHHHDVLTAILARFWGTEREDTHR